MRTDELKQIEFIDVDYLHFDPKNPRLPSSVVDGKDDEAVVNWMLKDASIIELMGSIGMKGFFPAEPLLVTRDGPKHFIVVEGNRRLAAVKLLLDPEGASKRLVTVSHVAQAANQKPKKLPVLVYDTREEILEYLGFKHITGVKAWSPLAKAKYLRELQPEYKNKSISQQYRLLAQSIGSRADYVKQLLIGLDLFVQIHENDYFDIDGLNEGTIDFGVFYNAIRWSNICDYIGVDPNNDKPTAGLIQKHLKQLVLWVAERNSENRTRLGESRQLGTLNDVLGNDRARKAFESGKPLAEAAILTELPDEIFSSSISDSLTSLTRASSYSHNVGAPNQADEENLNEINKLSKNLHIVVKARNQEGIEDE